MAEHDDKARAAGPKPTPTTHAPTTMAAPLDAATVKPTPTQEENDLAASGQHVADKEPDGSPADPNATPPVQQSTQSRQAEAGKGGPQQRSNYATRTSNPAAPTSRE
jgi:hypothetical protein